MNSDIDLKALWQQQPDMPAPDTKELFAKAAKLKMKTRNKIIITNILLAATCAFIVFIGEAYHPKMITTKLGILLMVIAMIMYLIVYNRLLPLLLKNNSETSISQYLQQFIRIKQKQEFLQKTILSIYFVLLSVGLFLYFIEVAGPMGTIGKAMVYGITALWILFNWFYIRPRTIKKQQAALDAMIDRLQSMNDQLNASSNDTII
ncbi:MAG: hypothetical protein P4L41_04780 [Flavipsychrobacter sp.]|nr:hypothetical protein [Flavipsychrobacter sp.]